MKLNLRLISSVLYLLLAVTVATAQEPRGAISGQVSDPNGAVIAGAIVSVTNLDTGQKLRIVTNDTGNYTASLLPIGSYRLEVEQAGFKRWLQDNVQVRVSDRLQIDVKLELGPVSESVTVTEGAPQLQAADASLGQLVDTRRIGELPIAHGNPYLLIGLSAGATFEGDPKLNRPYDPTHIVSWAMDGTKNNTSDITLDGVANTALASSNSSNNSVTASYVPPTDAIAEFKVQTAAFDAKIGQTSGGIVNIVLKSGANTPHGTAYYSGRTPALTANDFFANKSGIARGDFTYSRWGGSFTGPVYIPKLFDGHNKTFVMFAAEGIHDVNPRGQTTTVPTKLERTGDFSELAALGSKYTIYDPGTRVAVSGGHYQEAPFQDNKIPPTQISLVARAVLNYIPPPINDGTTADHQNNYPTPNAPENNKYSTYIGRIDQIVNDRHRFFVRADVNNRDAISKDWFNSAATGQKQDYGARGASFDDVYAFSPTFLVNVRYGYNRYVRLTAPKVGRGFDLTTLQFPASLNNAIDPTLREFPYFKVKNYFSTNNIGEDRNMDQHSLVGAFSKSHGAHLFEFGSEFRSYRQDRYVLSTQTSGYFDFDETWTRGPLENSTVAPLGQDFASFLLGIPDTKSLILTNPSMAEQSTAWMFYGQDSWRLARKLTVTAGLRYELEGPLTERYNRSVRGLDPTTPWPQNAAAQAAYATIYAANSATAMLPPSAFQVRGGLTFVGVNGQPNTAWNYDTNNFMPRIGLAYSPNEKTVVRAGFGMYFSPLGARRTDVFQSGFIKQTALVPTNDNIHFIGTLSNPFPNGILKPTGSNLGIQTEAANDILFFNTNIQAPYMQRWQLSVQRQLPSQMMLEVAYVGNKGVKLESETATPSTTNQVSISPYRDLNALPDRYLSTSMSRDAANKAISTALSASITNPFLGLQGFGKLSTATTIANSTLVLPFPQFGQMQTTVNDGSSWYHALQLRLEKRYSRGVTVVVGYTWSKYMEALDYLNPADPAPSRALSQVDHTHRLVTNWIYEIPFGKGRPFLSRANTFADAIIGGWQVQGVYTYQTGAPLTWLDASFYGDPSNIALNTRDPNQWFNVNAGFLTDSSLKPQNHLRTWPLRFGSVRNDGINNWDMSAIKNWKIKERLTLRFNCEFINAMNHARFKAPVTDPYNKGFGQVTDTASYPRIIQFGVKASF